MGEDWKPGDLALCVTLTHPKFPRPSSFLCMGAVYTVSRVGRTITSGPCAGEYALGFDEVQPRRQGCGFPAVMFRKIRPHTPDAEDAENHPPADGEARHGERMTPHRTTYARVIGPGIGAMPTARAVVNGAASVSALRASVPIAGETYRSEGVQMYCEYAPDERGDPTVEAWLFRLCEDDRYDGDGWLEIYVKEIVPTQSCGTLAVYYRQWFNPEGERLWSRKRVVGNVASLRNVIRRRKMTAQGIEARSGETGTGSTEGESPIPAGDAPDA